MAKFHDKAASAGSSPRGRLSGDQAVDLAVHVGQLAKAGLPLASGLAALADELPHGRLAGVLRDMSQQLDLGIPLDDVMKAQGPRLPAHVRGLVLAGVRSGHLDAVLEEFVAQEQTRQTLRRQIWSQLAYPLLLLSFIAVLCLFLHLFVVPSFVEIYDDFEMELPQLTQFSLRSAKPLAWTVATLVGLLIGGVVLSPALITIRWGAEMLYHVPLLGPLWRFSRLAQFARLMALLFRQKVPAPEAFRLAASSVSDRYLADSCHNVAEQIESGQGVSRSMAICRAFPPTLLPLVQWGEQSHALPDAFASAAEMFEGRVTTQGKLMETIFLPLVFVLSLGFVGVMVLAVFLPLISVINTFMW